MGGDGRLNGVLNLSLSLFLPRERQLYVALPCPVDVVGAGQHLWAACDFVCVLCPDMAIAAFTPSLLLQSKLDFTYFSVSGGKYVKSGRT